MLKVGQRIKLSDGIYRVKEVDSFKAKVVQEDVEVREFTTRFDKKVKIKSKPKVKFISPNAELKILPDKPLNSKPEKKQKPPTDKIRIVRKRNPAPKTKPVIRPAIAAAKKKTVPAKKVKKTAAPKTIIPLIKKKQTAPKKITAQVKKPMQSSVKPVNKSKKIVEPKTKEPDKFGQFSLF